MRTTDASRESGAPTDVEMPRIGALNRAVLSGAVVPVIVRAGWSIAVALGAAGLGIGAAYVRGLARGRPDPAQFSFGDVRDNEIGLGVSIGLGVALLVIVIGWWPTWRPLLHGTARLRAYWVPPLLVSVFAAALVTVLSVVIARQHWDDDEWAVLALALIAGAGAVMAWLPVVARIDRLRVELDDAQSFPVHCPACRHDLRAATHTTCPECGASFTLEELIRGQAFLADALRQVATDESASSSTSTSSSSS